MDDDGPATVDDAAAAIEQQLEKQQREEAERKRLEELRERVLFYLTTFFILLGIVSLFVFLFLVPFLIEPAITTILMEFDETPATCVTAYSEIREGASNCSLPGGWASCREGCTREIYECAQIFVNYTVPGDRVRDLNARNRRSLLVRGYRPIEPEPAAGWTYSLARIYPNVKGCGYPPHLNCTVFRNKYFEVGSSYPCYYSRVEPWVVITELDLAKSTRQLVYSMVFPIPCFVVSVVYVALAYFCVYAGRHRKPKVKRRVVRRMVTGGGAAGSGADYGAGSSASRAKSAGSEATPLTNNSGAAAVPSSPNGTGTPGSEPLYRRRGDDNEDDDASETYYGDQLRSTLAVDDSTADYVNALHLSEHTLRQSDSNEPSRGEWSDADGDCDDDDCEASMCDSSLERSIKAVSTTASTAPFPTNSTGYGPLCFF